MRSAGRRQNCTVTTAVWMDGWQQECCGEPFAVGQRVSWDVHRADREWLGTVLGAASADAIEWAEDHHGPVTDDERSLTGIVVSLRVVRRRYEPVAGRGSRDFAPVPGSATLTSIRSTDRRGREPDGQRFVGYVVELNEIPPPTPA